MVNPRRTAPSLYTLSLEYVMNNVHIYSIKYDLKEYLPRKIREQILKRLTITPSHWKGLNFGKAFNSLLHENMEKLDLTSINVDDELLQSIQVCKGLQRLCVTKLASPDVTANSLISLMKCLPNLEFLQMRQCSAVRDSVLESISENCPQLSALDLASCTRMTDKGLIYLRNLPNLRYVTLSKTKVTNNGLITFLHGPKGEDMLELKVDDCQYIDETGILAITNFCPNLEILIFFKCGVAAGDKLFQKDNKLKKLKQITWSIPW